MIEVARMLKRRMGRRRIAQVSRRGACPDWVVRTVAMFDPAVKVISSELGTVKNATSEKADTRYLAGRPRSLEDSLAETGVRACLP